MSNSKPLQQILMNDVFNHGVKATTRQIITRYIDRFRERTIRDTISYMYQEQVIYIVEYVAQPVAKGGYDQYVPAYTKRVDPEAVNARRPKVIDKYARQKRYREKCRAMARLEHLTGDIQLTPLQRETMELVRKDREENGNG